jgi:hypothetical protein
MIIYYLCLIINANKDIDTIDMPDNIILPEPKINQ